MRYEISGKSTGVGAYEDGLVMGHNPDYTDQSKTGNHWTHVYKDVPEKAIVVLFGHSRSGVPHRSVIHVDGTPVSEDEMKEVVLVDEWNRYEP